MLEKSQGSKTSRRSKNEIEYDYENSWNIDAPSSDDESSGGSENESVDNNEWRIEKDRIEKKHKFEMQHMKDKVLLYKKTEALQNEDHPGVKVLDEAIFTEPIMADIIKVAKLASKYNFDDIITDHPHTLQLLLSQEHNLKELKLQIYKENS